MRNYLYMAIVYSKHAKGFSDASMIRLLKSDFSSNTIRNIRKRLQDEKIIVPIQLQKKFPKNEKFFKINNLKKAEKVSDHYWDIWFDKYEKKESFPTCYSRIMQNLINGYQRS